MADTEENYMRVKDEKDIDQLCSSTWEPLYRFVYFKVRNREEAEDPTESMGQREAIENALKLLNDEQHLVVELRILKGYSVADTAKSLNMTEGNVRVVQYRALQKLAKLLKNEF